MSRPIEEPTAAAVGGRRALRVISGPSASKLDGTATPPMPERPMDPIRPRDFALMLLSIESRPTRQRARDQRSDREGSGLRRAILARLAELDPDPEAIEPALATLVDGLGPPEGPTRSSCAHVLQEWRGVEGSETYRRWLIEEALRVGADPRGT